MAHNVNGVEIHYVKNTRTDDLMILNLKIEFFVDRSLYMKIMCIKNSGDTFSEGLLKQG